MISKPVRIDAGELVVQRIGLFDHEAGTPPDLVLLWNEMSGATDTIDLILHLHGYSQAGAAMNIATEIRPISGLDFGDPDRPAGSTASRNRPSLALLPRGRYFGGRTGYGYDFPVLMRDEGWKRLKKAAAAAFRARHSLRRMPRIGRRILTVHSGGGAALMQTAQHFDPHEIHVFDGLYSPAPQLAAWAENAIAGDAAALEASPGMSPSSYMSRWGRALRVFYIVGTGTESASVAVAESINVALSRLGKRGDAVAPWYQVAPVAIEHGLIPRRLGWRLLADGGVGPEVSAGLD